MVWVESLNETELEVIEMGNGKHDAKEIQVLLIEVNHHIRSPLEKVFLAHGHQCTAVESGEQGLSALANQYYDAVICNQQLPGISGMEFFNQACRSLTGAITILTATFTDSRLLNDALAAGILVFLEMPFKIDNLLACIEERFSDICAGSLGHHLYLTSGGQVMMISPAFGGENPLADSPMPRHCQKKPSIIKGRRGGVVSIPMSTTRYYRAKGV